MERGRVREAYSAQAANPFLKHLNEIASTYAFELKMRLFLAISSAALVIVLGWLDIDKVEAFVPSQTAPSAPASSSVFPTTSTTGSNTALPAKKGGGGKKKKPAKKAGGGFGAKVATKEETAYEKALKAKLAEVKSSPTSPRPWLELGSVLMKLDDYAEAAEVFRLGNIAAPGDDMLSGAYTAIAGHSAKYFGGPLPANKSVDPDAVSCEFDTYDVGQKAEDFRTVSWTARGDRPRVQVSKGALLPREECAKAIEIAEAHAASHGGWTSSRHTQAATTDMPVKDIPELLDWFNDKLATTLFPMLAARYPDKISSPDLLRAHDSFIVKYDGDKDGAQNSLAVHTDESAFSFTIALNDRSEYEGGGTCFESIRLNEADGGDKGGDFEPLTLNADAGGVVAFPGTIRHGGSPVTKGVRYIIPLFLYLSENGSGKEPGYVTKDLEDAVEKAKQRQRLVSGFS